MKFFFEYQENLIFMWFKIVFKCLSVFLIICFCVMFAHNTVLKNSKLVNQFCDDFSNFSLENEYKIMLDELLSKDRKKNYDLKKVNEDFFRNSLNMSRKTLKSIRINKFGDLNESNFNEIRKHLNTKSDFNILLESLNDALSEPETDILSFRGIHVASDIEFYDL
jgi:hypothetical protein